MNLPKNVGKTDRNIRFAAAGLLVLGGILTNTLLLTLLGLVPLATAYFQTCPSYIPFNINTKSKDEV